MKKKVIARYGKVGYFMLVPYVLAYLGGIVFILYEMSNREYTQNELQIYCLGLILMTGMIILALVVIFRFYVVTDKYIKEKDGLWITHMTIDLTSVREIGVSPKQETYILPTDPFAYLHGDGHSAFPKRIYFSEQELTEKERKNLQYTARDKNIKIEFIELTNESKEILTSLKYDFGISVIE